MKFLVFTAVSVVLALAQRDPTKVCAPDTLQTGFYDFNRDVSQLTSHFVNLVFNVVCIFNSRVDVIRFD